MNETTLTNNIKTLLKDSGFWRMKIHGNSRQKSGIPDLLAIKNGMAWFFEVKVPSGKVSKLQEHRIKELRAAGAQAHVVRSVAQVRDLISAEPITESEV